MDGTSEKVEKYYFFASLTIAMRVIENGTDSMQWLLADHLGSTSVTANIDGSLNGILKYSAFGEIWASSGTTLTDYRYTNQLEQSEIGLYYYNARWYDPALGRFVQADTIVPSLSNSLAWDRYAYVMDNPIRYTDPSGHYEFEDTPDDPYFLPAIPGIMPARRSTIPYAYSTEERRTLIHSKGSYLSERNERWGLDTINASEQLIEYAASLYDKQMEHDAFMEDMTCAINGYCSGNNLLVYRVGFGGKYVIDSDPHFLGDEVFRGQGSWKDIYYDYSDNQLFHFWFYVAVAYFDGELVSLVGNIMHEPPRDIDIYINQKYEYHAQAKIWVDPSNLNNGYSVQDYLLGIKGAQLGALLRNGRITPREMGDWIVRNLGK